MAVFNFSALFDTLKTGVIALVKKTLKNCIEAGKADGQKMLDELKEKLDRWTTQLLQGNITKEDFEWLLYSQKQLVVMTALKEAGLGQIEADLFKANVLNLIKDTVFKALPAAI